jgi:hypothetical protein
MSNYTNEKVVGIPQVMNGIVLSPEEEELAKLGYKQEFTRDYSWFSTFSFAFSISGLLATMTVMPKLPGLIHIEYMGLPSRSRRSPRDCMVLV